MDQSLREPSSAIARDASDRTLRRHHHRQRRRRRHDGARAGRHAGAHPRPRARRLRAAGSRELETRRPSGSTCATGRPSAGSTSSGAGVPPVHALQRRRQHQVLGQRALPAAARGLRGASSTSTASRRRWPIDYDTLAPVLRPRRAALPRARRAGRRSDRAAARSRSVRADSARRRDGGDRRAAAAQGLHPSPLPLGLIVRASRRLHPLQHVQLVSVQDAREERRRRLLRAPGDASGRTSTLWTNAYARRLLTERRRRRVEAVEVERRGRDASASTRRSSSCRAARSTRRRCCCARRPTRIPNGLANSSGLVGRRYMAHLATMMQGFHPFRKNATVFQKTVAINDFYLRGPDTPYPARPDPVAGADARRHGADGRAAGFRCGRTTRGWRAASTGWRCPRICRRPTIASRVDSRRAHPAALPAEQPQGAPHARERDEADPAAARLLDRGDALARREEHDAPVRHARVRRPIRATSVLDPFCRAHDVDNLFVVDASFFPSSAAVNPALTIVAQALRVADHIARLT